MVVPSIGYVCDVMAEPASWSSDVSVADTSEIRAARNLVADESAPFVGAARSEDVRLAVSELATNALEHGDGADAVVEYGVDGDAFFVTVTADASAPPERKRPSASADQVSGRGLQIVAGIADSVLVSGDGRSVSVSCSFDLPAT